MQARHRHVPRCSGANRRARPRHATRTGGAIGDVPLGAMLMRQHAHGWRAGATTRTVHESVGTDTAAHGAPSPLGDVPSGSGEVARAVGASLRGYLRGTSFVSVPVHQPVRAPSRPIGSRIVSVQWRSMGTRGDSRGHWQSRSGWVRVGRPGAAPTRREFPGCQLVPPLAGPPPRAATTTGWCPRGWAVGLGSTLPPAAACMVEGRLGPGGRVRLPLRPGRCCPAVVARCAGAFRPRPQCPGPPRAGGPARPSRGLLPGLKFGCRRRLSGLPHTGVVRVGLGGSLAVPSKPRLPNVARRHLAPNAHSGWHPNARGSPVKKSNRIVTRPGSDWVLA